MLVAESCLSKEVVAG